MVRIFKTIDGAIHEIQEPQEGCWIALTNPTATEIFEISEQFGIEVDDLRAPLDEEERSRIEVEDNYTLILADVPAIEERNEKDWYVTIPLGIIVTQKMIFTVCLEDTQVLTRFMEGRVRNFFIYNTQISQIHAGITVQNLQNKYYFIIAKCKSFVNRKHWN